MDRKEDICRDQAVAVGPSQDSCEKLTSETALTSPVRSVVSQLSKGECRRTSELPVRDCCDRSHRIRADSRV